MPTVFQEHEMFSLQTGCGGVVSLPPSLQPFPSPSLTSAVLPSLPSPPLQSNCNHRLTRGTSDRVLKYAAKVWENLHLHFSKKHNFLNMFTKYQNVPLFSPNLSWCFETPPELLQRFQDPSQMKCDLDLFSGLVTFIFGSYSFKPTPFMIFLKL